MAKKLTRLQGFCISIRNLFVVPAGFSRIHTLPPKGGTTNTLGQLMQNPIARRVCMNGRAL